jgi:hypothetical protein
MILTKVTRTEITESRSIIVGLSTWRETLPDRGIPGQLMTMPIRTDISQAGGVNSFANSTSILEDLCSGCKLGPLTQTCANHA